MIGWEDIKTAPTDGRPVWVTGWDYGKVDGTRHYCWAYCHCGEWIEAGHDSSQMIHLTHWSKL